MKRRSFLGAVLTATVAPVFIPRENLILPIKRIAIPVKDSCKFDEFVEDLNNRNGELGIDQKFLREDYSSCRTSTMNYNLLVEAYKPVSVQSESKEKKCQNSEHELVSIASFRLRLCGVG